MKLLYFLLLPLVATAQNQLFTSLSSDSGQAGIMFDVQGVTAVSIVGMDINTEFNNQQVTVDVYNKNGSFIGYERNASAWSAVTAQTVTGKGTGQRTKINNFSIALSAGQVKGLYVQVRTGCSVCSQLRFITAGGGTGSLYKSDANLKLFVGKGKRPNFGRNVNNKAFSGALYYTGGSVTPTPPTPTPPTPTPPSPSPPTSPVVENRALSTGTAFNDGQAGIMFDVQAKKNISITSFSIVTAESSMTILLYHKAGTMIGYERASSAWTKLVSGSATGGGSAGFTKVPQFNSVGLTSGVVHAFYVTIETPLQTSPLLKYMSTFKAVGEVGAADDSLVMMVGKGKRYLFGRNSNQRIFTGKIGYYEPSANPPPPSPTPPTPTPPTTPTPPSPSPPSPSPPSLPVQTELGSLTSPSVNDGQSGIMFDVVTKSLEVNVNGICIHTKLTSDIKVLVYTKVGSMVNYERVPSAWSIISSNTLKGQGPNAETALPVFAKQYVGPTNTRAFYITIETSCQTGCADYIRYGSATIGSVVHEDSYLKILGGNGKRYLFGRNAANKSFSGLIKYLVATPTPPATPAPVIPAPTSSPSSKPSGPVSCPNLQPKCTGAADKSDLCVLTTLFTNNGGCSWTNKDRWYYEGQNVCQWYGVQCNSTGEVTKLTLLKNNLVGTIPTALGSFSKLTELNLGNNKLSGTIPIQLGLINSLRTLVLGINDLTGTIASAGPICKLPNLQSLEVDCKGEVKCDCCTSCSGDFPSANPSSIPSRVPSKMPSSNPSVSYNPSRQPSSIPSQQPSKVCEKSGGVGAALQAFFNGLEAVDRASLTEWFDNGTAKDGCYCESPAWLGITCDSNKVVSLSLPNLNLNGKIPTQIGGLVDLTALNLATNSFTGSIPTEMGSLVKLKTLNLSSNSIVGSIPTQTGGLIALTDLTLSKNKLTNPIPSELGNLAALVTFALESNSLSGQMPTTLGNLGSASRTLQTFKVNNNSLIGSLPSELGLLGSNLQTFSLGYNSYPLILPAPVNAQNRVPWESYTSIARNSGFIMDLCNVSITWGIEQGGINGLCTTYAGYANSDIKYPSCGCTGTNPCSVCP